MAELNLKNLRKKLSENGVFYTDRALAEQLKTFMPDDLTEVYDPTCGCGNLLAVFGDSVIKYGQELNPEQAAEAQAKLVNAHIVAGDTLRNPAFPEKRFRGIVANYPFSVKWEPDEDDERFSVAPCTAPPSKADWAFLLHILHMLSDDGVAAALCSPGVGFRGNREGVIRQWFVDQGYIHECRLIEGGHFVDTNIATLLLIIRKTPADKVLFVDCETNREISVTLKAVGEKGYKLDPKCYLTCEEEADTNNYNPITAEVERRHQFISILRAEIEFANLMEQATGVSVDPFIDAIIREANQMRKQPHLFV